MRALILLNIVYEIAFGISMHFQNGDRDTIIEYKNVSPVLLLYIARFCEF